MLKTVSITIKEILKKLITIFKKEFSKKRTQEDTRGRKRSKRILEKEKPGSFRERETREL